MKNFGSMFGKQMKGSFSSWIDAFKANKTKNKLNSILRWSRDSL